MNNWIERARKHFEAAEGQPRKRPDLKVVVDGKVVPLRTAPIPKKPKY